MNLRTTLIVMGLSLWGSAALADTAPAMPLANAGSDGRTEAAMASETLTVLEAAALLRVDPAAVVRLASAQKIPARQIEADWRFSRSALVAWLAGDWTIRTLVDPASIRAEAGGEARTSLWATGTALTAQAAASSVGRGASQIQPTTLASADPASPSIGVAPGQRTANEVFLRDQQVLLAPKEWTLDLGLLYSRRDRQLLAAANGGTVLANAESETFQTQLTARYSLIQDTEIFATTSHVLQKASIYAGDERLSRASRSEMGDIGIGLRHTLLREGLGRPDVIVSLDARIPTGDTSSAVGTSVTLVKSLDPAVLFGTLGYRRTFSREFADITRLEHRHRVDLTLGFAFALNDTLSLNTAIATAYNRAATFSATRLRQSSTTALQLGMTARVARGVYLQPSVSYRLSGPGTGFSLGLNVPVTF